MPGCCGQERDSQRRRRRGVLVTALLLITIGCVVCVVTVSVTVSRGKHMRFPYEGMALLAIGVGMMVVHSNCGVQKIRWRRAQQNLRGVEDAREPQRPPDAPPAYWTIFSLSRSPEESAETTGQPPTSEAPTSLPDGNSQVPEVVVVNETPADLALPSLTPPPVVLDVSALSLLAIPPTQLPMTSTQLPVTSPHFPVTSSQLPLTPPPSYPASRCDPDEQNGGREDFSDTDSLPPRYDDIADNTSEAESYTTAL